MRERDLASGIIWAGQADGGLADRLAQRLVHDVVTACSPCNLLKGNQLLRESGMLLQRYPSEPTTQELQENGRGFPPGYLHESWRDFLYWDSELDQT